MSDKTNNENKRSFLDKHAKNIVKGIAASVVIGFAYQTGKSGGVKECLNFGKERAKEFFDKTDS